MVAMLWKARSRTWTGQTTVILKEAGKGGAQREARGGFNRSRSGLKMNGKNDCSASIIYVSSAIYFNQYFATTNMHTQAWYEYTISTMGLWLI